ncbi:MAG: VWA domain-containing protein [Pirellulales bacterium]|nr:VWA domain-containing protein [Pirellulales bacterium]
MTLSFFLPRWTEWLLGLPPADSGEGTQFTFETAWLPAPWVVFLFALACLAFVAWTYHQQRFAARRVRMIFLALLRGVLVAGLLLMLTGFALIPQRTGLPYLVLLIDESESMQIADRYSDEALRARLLKLLERGNLHASADRANASEVDNAPPGVRRIDLAKSMLLADDAKLLRDLARHYKLRVYTVGAASRELIAVDSELRANIRALSVQSQSTRLGQGILEVLEDLRGAPPAAIVALSDGNTTDGENLTDAARESRRQQVPLFLVGLGSTDPPRNLTATDLLVDDIVFVNDVVGFEFKLGASGLAGQSVDIVLKERDTDLTVARATVTVDDTPGPQTVRLPYRPTSVGDFEYIVEVVSLSDEEDTTDNKLSASVSVRDDKIRVLYVESFPSYEYRFIKHMLQRDSTIELNVVLQQADRGFSQIDAATLPLFPVQREDLFAYDVILFGDVELTYFGTQSLQNIHDFVTEKGGGVVFIAGPRFNPLEYRETVIADLLPMDVRSVRLPTSPVQEEFRILPSELGVISPHMQLGDSPEATRQVWEELPTVRWFVEINDLKPAARVLAQHPIATGVNGLPLPLFVMQYVGAGKVLYHATDETHRWRRLDFQEIEFARYWVQTIRYLSRAKLMGKDAFAELTIDRRKYIRGESVRFRVRFPDERQAPADEDDVRIAIQKEGGRQQSLPLRRNSTNRGVFEGRLQNMPQGRYHAWVVSASRGSAGAAVDFDVTAPPGEYERTEMNEVEMREAATITGGRFYAHLEAESLLDDLPEGRQIVVESLQPIPVWNHPFLLGLLLALASTEWLLRRMFGLL